MDLKKHRTAFAHTSHTIWIC